VLELKLKSLLNSRYAATLDSLPISPLKPLQRAALIIPDSVWRQREPQETQLRLVLSPPMMAIAHLPNPLVQPRAAIKKLTIQTTRLPTLPS
jgi:hypothetical protein